MRITRLEITNLRRCAKTSIAPAEGLNLFIGDNGAGKTSVLEALHVMAYGRSFRGRIADGLIRVGTPALEVFVEWAQEFPVSRNRRAGLRHSGREWEGRLDGESVSQLGHLCAALAVVTFEPGSHVLISGGGEPRRRFMDWGLFHVEPAFLSLWRRYARALRQRNALLKNRIRDAQLDAWEQEMAAAGEPLTRYRQRYLEDLQPRLQSGLAALLPAAGQSSLEFQPGWRRDDLPLADALLLARERDLAAGFSSVGPHRADWSIHQVGIPGRSSLSRGQAKLTVLALLLAQAEQHAHACGEWPVVALDDMASEIDAHHQRRLLERLIDIGAQVFITGTQRPQALAHTDAPFQAFHVEQGVITPTACPQEPPGMGGSDASG